MPRKPVQMSRQIRRQIKRCYELGWNMARLMQVYRVSHVTVRHLLLADQARIRRVGEFPPRSLEEERALAFDYLLGVSKRALVRRYRCRITTIPTIAKRHLSYREYQEAQRRRQKDLPQIVEQRLAQEFREGTSLNALRRHHRISYYRLRRILIRRIGAEQYRHLAVTNRKTKCGHPRVRPLRG